MRMNLGYTQLIIDECFEQGCLRNQAAYILATAYWETARTMRPVKEAYWVDGAEAWRKKNLRYYPWYGRGFVQLTWEDNYIKAGKELGVDFTKNPDKVMEPKNSAYILVKGSMDGWFTGKKVSDYVTLKSSDFRGARRVINGTDKRDQIASIAKQYDKALEAMGYGVAQATTPEIEQVPIEPDGLDKPMVKSKTNWLTALQGAAGSAATMFTELNPYIQGAIILCVMCAAGYVISERKRYRDEARAIKAAL
ncbi:glycoside hydrolase family 19 protein [Lentilitoribacter sp. Alg239-R112]|uniref:glycoside hydrolase family 19 protein n=1 Tax=Lentilitoribacter sp. Alg239-R112 TaxID=2305987 RepID=UPI0013A6AFDB|nr:glycoside hydrolase family 19 protein [Lentilitoribacter sp. Alg239-R112]